MAAMAMATVVAIKRCTEGLVVGLLILRIVLLKA